jgi:hypothetical protein
MFESCRAHHKRLIKSVNETLFCSYQSRLLICDLLVQPAIPAELGRRNNRPFLEVERLSHNSGLSGDSIQRVVQPTITEDGKEALALKSVQPRVIAHRPDFVRAPDRRFSQFATCDTWLPICWAFCAALGSKA